MEDNLYKNKMEGDLNKKGDALKKMEDDLIIRKTIQSTKINLIGCDTIVNSPSIVF